MSTSFLDPRKKSKEPKKKNRLPFKLGYDVSGVVMAVGDKVPPHLQPGTEVYSRVPEDHRGTASEYVVSTASTTTTKPTSIPHVQAASIPLAALTALQALQRAEAYLPGGLKGKTVLVPASLSGTGSIAVQLAKNVFHAGRVITTLSPSKISKAAGLLGEKVLDQTVDYRTQDLDNVVPPGLVDFIFETVDMAMANLPLMKKGGMIVTVTGPPFGESNKVMKEMQDIGWVGRGIVAALHGAGSWNAYKARRYGVEYQHLFITPSATELDLLREWIDGGAGPACSRTCGFSR
jgi:NADPH:quinone reductase-like Zn-dependent oxidoreductase